MAVFIRMTTKAIALEVCSVCAALDFHSHFDNVIINKRIDA